jgi:hypothetical protein
MAVANDGTSGPVRPRPISEPGTAVRNIDAVPPPAEVLERWGAIVLDPTD